MQMFQRDILKESLILLFCEPSTIRPTQLNAKERPRWNQWRAAELFQGYGYPRQSVQAAGVHYGLTGCSYLLRV